MLLEIRMSLSEIFRPIENNLVSELPENEEAYFEEVLAKAKAFKLDDTSGNWWDCWHYHADMKSIGNHGWEYREPHLKALFTVYQEIVRYFERHKETPFQCWFILDKEDAGQDSVYIHTKNPNTNNFPIKVNELEWGMPAIEQYFEQHLPGNGLKCGVSRETDEFGMRTNFYVFSDKGIPLI